MFCSSKLTVLLRFFPDLPGDLRELLPSAGPMVEFWRFMDDCFSTGTLNCLLP